MKQCSRLAANKINLKEFIIAKEYRGRDTYDNVKSIAACQIANRALLKDSLAEPLACERVPYVIVCGSPSQPLYELVRSPEELIQNTELKLNYEYYVMKQILPPIDRIMCLLNLNVFDWMKYLSFKPKIFRFTADSSDRDAAGKCAVSISKYIYSTDCLLCGKKKELTRSSSSSSSSSRNKTIELCKACSSLDQVSILKLRLGFQKSEKKLMNLLKVCQICTANNNINTNIRTECISIDCPNTFLILNAKQELIQSEFIRKTIDELF